MLTLSEKASISPIVKTATEQGITGERFADTVARIGFEEVQRQLLDSGLLARKQENLAAQKHMKGGATC